MSGAGKKRVDPEGFIETFTPGTNDFAINITKVFPPEVKETWAQNAYLIKIRIALNMSAEEWKYFTRLADTLKNAKMFCGLWTPDVGDVVIDDYGCYVEMVAYIRTGTEEKLVHLDKVITASPKLGMGAQMITRSEQDARFVEAFVDRIRSGVGLEEAMERTREDIPVSSEEPVEKEDRGKYVIGGSVVVVGGIADRLQEAEKSVEEDLEDDNEE